MNWKDIRVDSFKQFKIQMKDKISKLLQEHKYLKHKLSLYALENFNRFAN